MEIFVGREAERAELSKIVAMGGGRRCVILGDAGVGKTTLANFVRKMARENTYFSPINEIQFQEDWTINEVVINTLQAIYSEIKSKGVTLSNNTLITKLEDLFELYRIVKDSDIEPRSLMTINTTMLLDLFKKVVNELVVSGYRAVILHYNNFDNIDDDGYLVRILNILRDYLMAPNVIFILIGDQKLVDAINVKPRLRQIFTTSPIRVGNLSLENVKQIIHQRIEALKLTPTTPHIAPHSDDAIEVLYELFNGNIRDILNSLSESVNVRKAIELTPLRTKEALIEIAKRRFVSGLSEREREVLNLFLEQGELTNTEIALKIKQKVQNISPILKTLREMGAIKLDRKEGTKKFYKITTEASWLKLKITDKERLKEKEKEAQELSQIQKRVIEFFEVEKGKF